MIFKSYSESAALLAQKIKEENLSNFILSYINSDAKDYCQLIADNLNTNLQYLPGILNSSYVIRNTKYIILIDDGTTSSQEYNEFTDIIRKNSPKTKIILAIPVIPQSEENQLKKICDSLITLHIEPLFFSIKQFYPTNI